MTSPVSWIEASLLVAAGGALWVRAVDSSPRGRWRALVSGTLACALAVASWADFVFSGGSGTGFRALERLAGGGLLAIDGVNAPLLPLASLLALVTMAATLRTKIHRFSFSRTLILETLVLLTLCARAPWLLILLMGASALPVVLELAARGRPVRVMVIHVGASVLLLAGGWTLVSLGGDVLAPGWEVAGYGLVAAGVAIRSGLLPAHCWVVDLFENAALGTSLLATLSLLGVVAAARLLVPGAPEPVLLVLLHLAVVSALYNAAMSTVQSNARRFVCQVTLSNKALVFAGVVLPSTLGLTAGLVLWISVPLSVVGLGLTIRSLEARVGRLSLNRFNGLHDETPTLTALYLVFGLASVGFPGTVGFFGAEMLTDAAARESKALAAMIVLAATLTGIAVVRAYGKLFLGARHPSSVDLKIRKVELAVLLLLAGLLVGGTVWPQPGISSRKTEADAILVGGPGNRSPNGP